MGVDFFERVNEGYKKASELPMLRDVWKDVDGRGTIDEVFEKVLNTIPKMEFIKK